MGIFEDVKSHVSVRDVAIFYGFHPNRAGLIVCPFHNDKHPSCKVDHRFHCFACGADGDVIDFVSKLYGLSALDGAKKIASDFGIAQGYESRASPSVVRRLTEAQQYRSDEKHCLNDLVAYKRQLGDWEMMYAPKSPTDAIHPHFVEAMHRKDYIDYLIDLLISGEEWEQKEVVQAWKGGEISGVHDSRGGKGPA